MTDPLIKPFGVIKVEGRLTDKQYDRLEKKVGELKERTGLSEVVILEDGTEFHMEPNLGVWNPEPPTEMGWYRVWDYMGVQVVNLAECRTVGEAGNDVWEDVSHYPNWLWDHRRIEFLPIPEEAS